MSNPELIRKAARGKDLHRIGCFMSNRSALKLEQRGADILPDIESFLSGLDLPEEQASVSFSGLTNVLLVYFASRLDMHLAKATPKTSRLVRIK